MDNDSSWTLDHIGQSKMPLTIDGS